MARNLKSFKTQHSISRKFYLTSWYLINSLFFRNFLLPNAIKSNILRIFGARIGSNVILRGKLRIHLPYNLIIGDDCWIGEEVWFINHEKIVIGSNVCISQRSIICSGGHDYKSKSLEYAHKPIEIKDGVWICLDAKILPGVTVGENSVVSAGEIARKSIPDCSILIGGQIRQIESPK